VYRQQAEQLGTRVTGAADNADIDHRCPRGHGADSSIVRAFHDIGMEGALRKPSNAKAALRRP
jgi:hypothetical protein